MLEKENTSLRHFPGPTGFKLLQLGLKLQSHKMSDYQDMHKQFGQIVRCPWINKEVVFIFDPNLMHYVLKKNHTNYQKSSQYEHMKPLLGNGLLLSEGPLWRKQRSIMAKEFHQQRLSEFRPIIENFTFHYFKEHAPSKIGEEHPILNLYDFLSELTFKIACELFFGSQFQNSGVVQNSFLTEATRIQNRTHRPFNFPPNFPTMENVKSMRAIKNLKSLVEKIMTQSSHSGKNNILSKLLLYKDTHDQPMEQNLIRDEVMTLMLAGHETTSTGLMWTIFLLIKNPHYQKLYQSLKDNESQTKKSLIQSFLLEGMRLYPPVPLFSRRAISTDCFNGFDISTKASLACVPYVLHRNEEFWKDANVFFPERFLNCDYEKDYEHIYVPFAKGPRACIGKDLAMLESEIILAFILDHFTLRFDQEVEIIPLQNLTLRPNKNISIVLKRNSYV